MKQDSGVTLLEILIATVIILLTAVAAFSALITVNRAVIMSDLKRNAAEYAMSTLEWLKDKVTFNTTDPRYADPQGIYALAPGAHTYPINSNDIFVVRYKGERAYIVEDRLDSNGNLMFKKVTVTVKYTPER